MSLSCASLERMIDVNLLVFNQQIKLIQGNNYVFMYLAGDKATNIEAIGLKILELKKSKLQ